MDVGPCIGQDMLEETQVYCSEMMNSVSSSARWVVASLMSKYEALIIVSGP